MQRRDGEEFTGFAREHGQQLQALAYLLTGDWYAAQDLVQSTLAKTYLAWHRVCAADSPVAYVRRILVNEAKQAWRRSSLRPEVLSAALPEAAHDDGFGQRDDRNELLTALMSLPPRQRAVVVLRYFDGLNEAEAASAMNCSLGTVKSQTHKALKSLRSTIDSTKENAT